MSSDTQDEAIIPVLDISVPDAATGKQLVDAAERYGFVFIRIQGSDISPKEIDEAFELSCRFFALPAEEKGEYRITPDNRGWSSKHSEILDQKNQRRGDFKEAFNFGEFSNGKAQQPLPGVLAAHEANVDHFANLCRQLCLKLLRLFALGLEIDDREGGQEWFSSHHDSSKGPSGSILRFLYYPPTHADYDPTLDIRAGAHSDYGSLTLLFQRPAQPGLQILSPSHTWTAVPVHPPGTSTDAAPPILVNIGDLLSYWTNGLLLSTVHRVVAPPATAIQERFSIAYFCHPLDQTRLVPVPSERVRARKDMHMAGEKPITAAEHLKSRLAATYGWHEAGQ